MKVKKSEKVLKIKNKENINIKNELIYILSQKIIGDLFILGEISLKEYRKIRKENQKKFKPYLYKIMP
ncbi:MULTISPECIES: SHOCT domain-containing protein [unclassified Gemella]|uniref:SHOCT domain-containing protein n=1 Tax=unclassified Gemella TaxID=2624949 RepID=UPI0015D072EE|nr:MULTISPECIES: SHOCT domain-containing protein [unclassified Gemella]MBF0710679.1 hypothetical protein [Gemella sp. GL1.1]NYS28023.1 hypothetical protein [Gemella sp. GL1]